jgi:hypothetical protein
MDEIVKHKPRVLIAHDAETGQRVVLHTCRTCNVVVTRRPIDLRDIGRTEEIAEEDIDAWLNHVKNPRP